MARAIKKTIILIALIIFAAAATWYACKVSSIKSLDESGATYWLHSSELLLIGSSVLLAAGLFGEWSDSESWKKRFVYKLSKAAVIIGVVGELLGDGGIFEAGDRLQEIKNKEVAELNLATERLRASNLDLIAKFAWRELTTEQQSAISDAVRQYTGTLFDSGSSNEPESLNLLNEIMVSLNSAGWVKRHCNCGGLSLRDAVGRATSLAIIGTGVDILYEPGHSVALAPAAAALAAVLNSNGVVARAAADTSAAGDTDNVHLRVASKPR